MPLKESKTYLLSADFSENKDESVMIVSEFDGIRVTCVNMIKGHEAEKLWAKLVGVTDELSDVRNARFEKTLNRRFDGGEIAKRPD